ncbi:MAG: hypothetical protein ACLPM3_00910 [Terracidiphilus sp.]
MANELRAAKVLCAAVVLKINVVSLEHVSLFAAMMLQCMSPVLARRNT